jgi:hypothetical protein
MKRLERNARAAIALEMQAVGRAKGSLEVLRALESDPDATPCERVEVANDIGWGALLVNEAAGARIEDARAPLERAIGVEGCRDAYVRSFALGNLARLALDEGDVETAKARLAAAKGAVVEPRGTERLFWLDMQARIVLVSGRAKEALASFDEEERLARAALLPDAEWAGLVGRAAALEAMHRTDAALAALASAEDVTDRAMLLVPLGEGRASFVADRSASARAAIELLVAAGRIREAAQIARRSRARVLASVQRALRIESLSPEERMRWESAVRGYRAAREAIDTEAAHDWSLSADRLTRVTDERKAREHDLRAALEGALAVLAKGGDAGAGVGDAVDGPPLARDGAIALVVHPGRSRWFALALDAGNVTAHVVPAPEQAAPDELARALLDPIAERVEAAHTAHVLAYGAWRTVDVHALAFRGAPLAARVAVDSPLGLGSGAREPPVGGRLVVVGNPTGDLPRSRVEADEVARALATPPTAGMVTELAGPAATRHAVGGVLGGAALLHFAGHGLFAGEDGFESSLPLAEGGRLTIGDVLALAPAPRRVVLSGCDAARSDGDSEGLGLAQAFLAAGAEEVVAPVRPVSDVLAERLASALYADGPPPPAPGALATALQHAQAIVRDADPSADWAAFRVLAH